MNKFKQLVATTKGKVMVGIGSGFVLLLVYFMLTAK